jgi:Tfp pilus assembly protein FimT
MKSKSSYSRGFSLVEVIIIITIMIVILAIAMSSFSNMRSRKQVEVVIDSINFKLEEAKTNAVSGKNGKSSGIYFSTTTYIYFNRDSYLPTDTSNSSTTMPNGLEISSSISDGSKVILFSRLTGFPQATGTITVRSVNTHNTATVTVGTFGDINITK